MLDGRAGQIDQIWRHQRRHAGQQEAAQPGTQRRRDRDIVNHAVIAIAVGLKPGLGRPTQCVPCRGILRARQAPPNPGNFTGYLQTQAVFGTYVATFKWSGLGCIAQGDPIMSTIAATTASVRKPLYRSLFVQVLVTLLLGIVLGMAVPAFAGGPNTFRAPLPKLISVAVAPIAFSVQAPS